MVKSITFQSVDLTCSQIQRKFLAHDKLYKCKFVLDLTVKRPSHWVKHTLHIHS